MQIDSALTRAPNRFITVRFSLVTLLSIGLLSACGDSSSVEPEARIVEGVDFSELFAPPSSSEINTIMNDWAGRDVSAQAVLQVATSPVSIGSFQATLRVVSHNVNGAQHFGAILVPAGAQAGSLPVLVFAHGGDDGLNLDATLSLLPFLLGNLASQFVFIAPSFRSEALVFQGTEFLSGGEPSPWDHDVDDALALLNVALETTTEADPNRIGVLGFSRGACVGLLMAERDPRIDLVVEFFGPTDFFGPFVQDVVEEALRGGLRDLPGLNHLNDQFIQPLRSGQLSIEDMRLELLRRSPVNFGGRLPDLQVHHGTADGTVPVGEAERLIEVMQGLGRGEPEFEFHLYQGGGHDPLTLPNSLDRARTFLGRLLSPPSPGIGCRLPACVTGYRPGITSSGTFVTSP
ncbi:MAG: peptidase [Gemmatimonadota bacterium]